MTERREQATWNSWRAMKSRCLNRNAANFPRYGGRGICICERWMEFANFLQDMGPRPIGMTLDRIDNDGKYEPSNCRWIEHAKNVRQHRKYIGPLLESRVFFSKRSAYYYGDRERSSYARVP